MIHFKHTAIAYRTVMSTIRFNHKAFFTDSIHWIVCATIDWQISFCDILIKNTFLDFFIRFFEQLFLFWRWEPKLYNSKSNQIIIIVRNQINYITWNFSYVSENSLPIRPHCENVNHMKYGQVNGFYYHRINSE